MLHFYKFYTLDTMAQHLRLNGIKSFDEKNYSTWKLRISVLLEENYVNEMTIKNLPSVKDRDVHWLKKNALAKSLIIQNLVDNQLTEQVVSKLHILCGYRCRKHMNEKVSCIKYFWENNCSICVWMKINLWQITQINLKSS